ncbi:DUF2785 domain-containing protein [Streptococcus sp. S784/96/1]|uniref:DUF2785 domain-containing protein n=1 Tax=Streptococcus sp. S784/96/1 TaxID=2653499 RepID=UPI001386F65C|nr:DUF2785 domain-containing protein [Streptococcus sp. S784/96/1]
MIETLQHKLNSLISYTDEELAWCLLNIGHPDPEIRDNLIYNTFGYGLEHQLISPKQFLQLAQQLQNKRFLKHPDTLTRSFSALLASLLLFCDNLESSPYFSLLENSRAALFKEAFDFLKTESDTRGYDDKRGWIHAIAHGAEFLMATSLHETFPQQELHDVWQTTIDLLYKQKSVFSAGEADRLAFIFIQLVISEKLEQKELAKWISNLSYSEQSPEDYFCSLNIQAFLAKIYLTCEKEEILKPELKQAILTHY